MSVNMNEKNTPPAIFTATAGANELKPNIEQYKKRITSGSDNQNLSELFDVCEKECRKVCTPKACYMIIETSIEKDVTAFGDILCVESGGLARALDGCKRTVIFGATVGLGLDRLIAKYSVTSPAKAWLCQGIGALLIEAWCDLLCARISAGEGLYSKPRYSPGYGDLPIEIQNEVSRLLCLPKRCGITLTDKFIMLPTKSVTAFMGLSETPFCPVSKCSMCNRKECEYRND